jgi:hypothetical protein
VSITINLFNSAAFIVIVIVNPSAQNGPKSLTNSTLVQKQTTFGKDKSNPFTAGGLLKITWLSSVPQFSHLASPEVMAFGKEFFKSIKFSEKIARD